MSTIVTRAGKGSALTWAEGDANITNLNTDKYQSGDNAVFTSVIVGDGTGADPSLEVGTAGNGFWAVATDEIAMSLNGLAKYYYNGTTNYTVMGINAAAGIWGGAISPVSVLVVGDTSALMSTASTTKLMYNTYFNSSYNLVYRNSGMSAGYLDFGGAQLSFFLAPSGTAGNTIVFSNPLRIDETDVELLCGQLKFPAVQVPSADANTLDDYEEGTWSITDTSGAGLSLTASNARYVKIGRTVTVMVGTLTYPATADVSNAKISLPFAAMTGGFGFGGQFSMPWVGAAPIVALTTGASSNLSFYNGDTTGARTNAELSGLDLYGLTLTYWTAD